MEIKINTPINNIISFLAIAPVLQITKDNDIGEKIIKKFLKFDSIFLKKFKRSV